jgi:hypothetical protein
MLAYFLKVNVAIVLFYAFYRLFFYKDTFFGWRRTALLCFFAVSAAVPLLNIQTWITEQEPMVAMADLYASVVLPELTVGTEAAPTDWKSILSEYANIAYWGIAALLMIRMPMPQDTNRQHKYTSASQGRRAFLFFPLDFYPSVLAYGRGVQRNIDP